MNSRIMFLFGAGAERFAGLPSGGEYTRQTMLTKNSNLYEALREFYANSATEKIPYEEVYMFQRNSHTLFEIVSRALSNYDTKSGEPYTENENLNRLLKIYSSFKRALEEDQQKIKKEIMDELYPAISHEKPGSRSLDDYGDLVDNFSYYGAVEKDFSSLASPKKAGKRIFWRLINYFWTAFFAIYGPLTGKTFASADDYGKVLGNLSEVREIWVSDKIKRLSKDSYYAKLKKEFPKSVAVTTNYTPFVEQYWKGQSIYLAGKLTQMEDPLNLELLDLRKKPDLRNRLVFPFMMTQAPIKPIVFPEQIREYSKFDKALRRRDLLVIIGYSLSENDNHVNVYLREFLKKQGKPIIYCNYVEKRKKPKSAVWLLERLNISEDDPVKELVHIVPFENEKDLYRKLKTKVKEIQED